jgi:hypothetical protein
MNRAILFTKAHRVLVVSRMARLMLISLCIFFVVFIDLTKADAPTESALIQENSDGGDDGMSEFSVFGGGTRRHKYPRNGLCPEGHLKIENRCVKEEKKSNS